LRGRSRRFAGALYFSADGRYLAFTISHTTAQECTTVIYDINIKRVVFKLPAFGPPGCQDFAFTRDGRYLLYREYSGQDQLGNEIRDITALAWQTGETRRI
jgi:predicted secreted protein